ncbi:MAG: N4-gp56 family major capsid protein [Epsilonproteobacteria bacterium]|nr:N4-gp56 family major capsid protein [Campylobacterota bacterium]
MAMNYNNGTVSTIGPQFNTYEYKRKALIETAKTEYFSQLGDVETLSKNYGQKLKKYHYIPLLDDRNVNDQGIDANGVTIANGNLYGSSKDPGYIASKLPVLSENGGRVNRVGFKRMEVEGEIHNYGFFYEWSQDSMNFDTDADLYSHINREALRGAREISEDIIQKDLLDAAGIVMYTGDATSIGTTGYNDNETLNSIVKYNDLVRLGVRLDDNRCPKDTKAITGSKDTDVVNIQGARYMFIGSELIPTLMRMKDYHGERAFIPLEKYAQSTPSGKYVNALHGEIGSVAGFRIVVVPEMMGYIGKGEDVDDESYLNDGNKYNVYPMLVIGSGSFAHIRFQVSGDTADKFNIIVRKPGTFANPEDPYEKIGYSSIQFWQGTLVLRPEWIAKILTLAKG